MRTRSTGPRRAVVRAPSTITRTASPAPERWYTRAELSELVAQLDALDAAEPSSRWVQLALAFGELAERVERQTERLDALLVAVGPEGDRHVPAELDRLSRRRPSRAQLRTLRALSVRASRSLDPRDEDDAQHCDPVVLRACVARGWVVRTIVGLYLLTWRGAQALARHDARRRADGAVQLVAVGVRS